MSDLSQTPDRELLDAARRDPTSRSGRAAAGELLGRHRQAVYLWCFRYVREHERALDMAQDVLLHAFERLGQFEGRAAFSSWLFVIARNRCLNEIRRDLWRDDVDLDSLADGSQSVEDRVEAELQGDRLAALANATLDPLERKAIWLRYSERMPIEAITSLLDLDQKSGARGLLQRARRKLRTAIDGEQEDRPVRGGDS